MKVSEIDVAEISPEELSNMLTSRGYVNRFNTACANTLASMLMIDYKNARRALNVGLRKPQTIAMLYMQLGLAEPDAF